MVRMATPIDTFLFYTKLLTALVIVLNFTTVASLYLLTLWLRFPEKAVQGYPATTGSIPSAGGSGVRPPG